ncbi:MAG TPA: EamA family transporter, partial [Acidimicrobiia bacterium]|nr:EamA family transporter [Acidimicrobiia bacterium]
LPRLPAVETATFILIQPALTMIWGAMVFDERPSTLQILGAVIVLAGVGVVASVRARMGPETVTSAS